MNEGEWRGWNLAKAIFALKGEVWASEPLQEEVKFALNLLRFKVYSKKVEKDGYLMSPSYNVLKCKK